MMSEVLVDLHAVNPLQCCLFDAVPKTKLLMSLNACTIST